MRGAGDAAQFAQIDTGMILDFGEAGRGVDMVEPWPAGEAGADGRPYGVGPVRKSLSGRTC